MTELITRLSDLSDLTRGRILLALEDQELSVSELQAALQLPQSTVSRHLKILGDGGWVASRPDGASQRYRLLVEALAPPARQLWSLVRDEAAGGHRARRDRERLRAVLADRHARSRAFFSTEAGRWEGVRADLFGRRPELFALLGLLDQATVVGDLGCGTGHLSAALAPFVARVVAVDESAAMLDAARARCAGLDNVDFRHGELELLPVSEMELDVAVVALVLPYVTDPARLLAEAARALQPCGRLVVMDLQPHDRADLTQTLGHLRQGVDRTRMAGWLRAAGLVEPRYVPLPPDPAASGPALFVATGRKPD